MPFPQVSPVINYSGTEGGASPPPAPSPGAPAPVAAPAATQPSDTQARQLADARADAAANRIQRKDALERAEALQSELDRVRAASEQAVRDAKTPLEAKLAASNDRTINAELKAAAVHAGLRDPDLLVLIAKAPGAPKLEMSDDGEVKGVPEAVEAFKKWKPEYFQTAPAGGGAGVAPPVIPPRSTGSIVTPPPAGGAPAINLKTMSKNEYETWKRSQLSGLRRAN